MKIEAKKLADLNKQYSKLKKDEKIISLTEARKMLDDIIDMQEKLEQFELVDLVTGGRSVPPITIKVCEEYTI